MDTPLISVIVPVYNVEKYVSKCLDSILQQSYHVLEIILVDDGSTDRSGEICAAYARQDARIRLIRKQNGGLGNARRAAMEVYSGEYVAFVDSDDWIEPNMLESLLTALRENQTQLAICGVRTEDENGGALDESRQADTLYPSGEALLTDFLSKPHIRTAVWNKLYHKNLFADIRFPTFRTYEDAYVMHRILGQVKTAVYVGDCLYIQLIRTDSLTNVSFNKSKMAILECRDDLQRYVAASYPKLGKLAHWKKIQSVYVLLSNIIITRSYRKCRPEYRDLRRLLREETRSADLKRYPFGEKEKTLLWLALHCHALFFIHRLLASVKLRHSRRRQKRRTA
jgi:glycosyltransferase involved in cell wall biosynthesis